MDVVDPKTRSRMMAGIRHANTRPEIEVRKALHKMGFRYRLHARDLPGSPDIVLPRYRAVIFVQGCFWHMHGCARFKWPATRQQFWKQKLVANHARDQLAQSACREAGWRVCIVWECALKFSKVAVSTDHLISGIADWLRADDARIEFPKPASAPSLPVPSHPN